PKILLAAAVALAACGAPETTDVHAGKSAPFKSPLAYGKPYTSGDDHRTTILITDEPSACAEAPGSWSSGVTLRRPDGIEPLALVALFVRRRFRRSGMLALLLTGCASPTVTAVSGLDSANFKAPRAVGSPYVRDLNVHRVILAISDEPDLCSKFNSTGLSTTV